MKLDVADLLAAEQPKNEAYRVWVDTAEGPKNVAVPLPCQCGDQAVYGKMGRWYCLTHWIESKLWV